VYKTPVWQAPKAFEAERSFNKLRTGSSNANTTHPQGRFCEAERRRGQPQAYQTGILYARREKRKESVSGDRTVKSQKTFVALAIFLLLGSGIVAARPSGKKKVPLILNNQTFNYWRNYIHPSAAESAWQRPGWQTSLWAGLTVAQEKKKPLLAWFMTGHPCGMT
jgi:hypothetical protein